MAKFGYLFVVLSAGLGLAFALIIALPAPAEGASSVATQTSIVVDSLEDEDNNDGDCSLREAIRAATEDNTIDACLNDDGVITDTITFTVSGTIILSSQLDFSAGGPLSIDGGEEITVSGNHNAIVFNVNTGAEITLNHLTISDGNGYLGGGIYNAGRLILINSTLSNNNAMWGGAGILNQGTVSMTNITLSGNFTEYMGGGIANDGVLTVTNSTLSGNSAFYGGGISNFDGGSLTLKNSTLSGNNANSNGGGIDNEYATMTVTNSTISGNSAFVSGGIYNYNGALMVSNSIIAGSPGGSNCFLVNPLTDAGYNIEDANTCGFDSTKGSLTNTVPLLGLLLDNGGPTLTHALLFGSPAIDAGDSFNCPPPLTDQRGVLRPLDGDENGEAICDIGSFEGDPEFIQYPTTTTITSDSSIIGQPFSITFQVTSAFGIPTGVVTITVDIWPGSCSAALVDGVGECSLTLTNIGTHTLIATYSGDAQFARSIASELHTVGTVNVFLPITTKNFYTCGDFFDDFSYPESGWTVMENDTVRTEYLNGEYRILVKPTNYFWAFGAPTCAFENYSAETDVRWSADNNTGWGYGLVFGIPGDYDQFYLFGVNSDFQEFELYHYYLGNWRELATGASSAISAGTATNHLKVTRNGSSITLEVNGVQLVTINELLYVGETYVGLVVETYSDVPNADARFDNFSLTRIGSPGGSSANVQGDIEADLPQMPGELIHRHRR